MAGDDDRNGVGATGLAGGPGGFGTAQDAGEFAVGAHASDGDAQHRVPQLLLEPCAHGEIQWRQFRGHFSY